MTYVINSTLIDSRAAAINAIAESFLSADGLNGPDEIRAAIEDAEDTADELISVWGGTISTQETDEEGDRVEEPVSRAEWISAIREIDPEDFS